MRLFTKDKNFYKTLTVLAVPVALQNFITFCVNLADNIMVGGLGDAAVSGVFMGNQIQTFLQLFSGGIEGAVLILASQYWGKKNTDAIKKLISIGFQFTTAFSILLTLVCFFFPSAIISVFTNQETVIEAGAEYLRLVCLSYIFFSITQLLIAAMRSVEVANIGMWVSAISLVVNITLNYIFIFVLDMSIAGAAIATVISRIVELAVMIIYITFIDKKLALKPKDFLTSDTLLRKDFIKYGLPVIGGQCVWGANMMISSAIIGRFEEDVITAFSIANSMNNLCYVVMNGMSSAVGIITGKTIGEGKVDLMKEYARTVQMLFLILGIVTGITFCLLKSPFITLYKVIGTTGGISDAAAECAMTLLSVLQFTVVGTCYQAACLFGLVKSGGDVSFVFKNDSIFVFLVVLPAGFIAQLLGAAPWVVFLCLKADQILKCIVAVIKINSFNWMKKLTRENAGKDELPEDAEANA